MGKLKKLRSKHRKTDNKLIYWVYVGLALTVLQYLLELQIVGLSTTYSLLIYWIPTLLGLIVLAVLRWPYLLRRMAATKGILWKVGLTLFFLVQGLLFSYCSFGLVARTTAELLNRAKAENCFSTTERYPIAEAFNRRGRRGSRTRSYVEFEREGKREQIRTGRISELSQQRWYPPFDIVLETKPGIMGCSIVVSYSIVPYAN